MISTPLPGLPPSFPPSPLRRVCGVGISTLGRPECPMLLGPQGRRKQREEGNEAAMWMPAFRIGINKKGTRSKAKASKDRSIHSLNITPRASKSVCACGLFSLLAVVYSFFVLLRVTLPCSSSSLPHFIHPPYIHTPCRPPRRPLPPSLPPCLPSSKRAKRRTCRRRGRGLVGGRGLWCGLVEFVGFPEGRRREGERERGREVGKEIHIEVRA